MENQSPSKIEDLIETAAALQYVGQFLLQATCNGYEAEKHWASIKMIEDLFKQADDLVKTHPQYKTRLEEQKAKTKGE